ncbi:DUF2653 family protein [Paenibacillus hexagrammi]|uniref:YxcD family protein n=1 Tax=Paenibacillus hexagrammi TaxID=2908839 RepID=A0ABY3SLW8_9BACL|nr:DUF2653 family protein [Paenibacillus sp. YPD9-1]UJF34209.1 YxcD family protein [Paenibacillus sp. YPD9-1]
MKIWMDQQDVLDAVHVYIAAQENGGRVEGSAPHNVHDVQLFHDEHQGFSAKGLHYGRHYRLNQQDVIDAVSVYLSAYYSFRADRLLVKLLWEAEEEQSGAFSADVIVER